MENQKIKFLIVIGLVAIIGVVITQSLWLKDQFDYEEKKFNQKVHIALLEVVEKLRNDNQEGIPITNPVSQLSNDYFVVNINYDINAEILEFYLKNEFEKLQVATDYEYAIYDCETDEMVYGNYISQKSSSKISKSEYFPKFDNLVYYFAIHFPNKGGYYFKSLKTWVIVSAFLFIILGIYVYSIFVILKQKKYSELQRDFINNMTHEFKTPLSSILIASNYLQKQAPIKGSEKLSKYTETIIQQGNRLNNHVEKILSLAKSENTPIVLDKVKLNAKETIEIIVDNFRIKYDANVKLSVIAKGDHHHIIADEIHFSNLIYNLIDNAIKYSVNEPNIIIQLEKRNNQYQIDIIDEGMGISSTHQKHVFKKFYRVPVSKSDHVNGFGLGLYYVYKICQLHLWQIQLKSKLGNGTTFSLSIPS